MAPFEIVYGRTPPAFTPYSPGDSRVEAVDQELKRRHTIIKELRSNLQNAQDRMKRNADLKRKPFEFNVGDWVSCSRIDKARSTDVVAPSYMQKVLRSFFR